MEDNKEYKEYIDKIWKLHLQKKYINFGYIVKDI